MVEASVPLPEDELRQQEVRVTQVWAQVLFVVCKQVHLFLLPVLFLVWLSANCFECCQQPQTEAFVICIKWFCTQITNRHNYDKHPNPVAQIFFAVGFLYKDGALHPRMYHGSVGGWAPVPSAWLDHCPVDSKVLVFCNHKNKSHSCLHPSIIARATVAICSPQNPVDGIFTPVRHWLSQGHQPVNQVVAAQSVGDMFAWDTVASKIGQTIGQAALKVNQG